ncbi:MAG: hypothetical protein QMC89_03050 [Candidatus Hodarchaeaceae archaeon]|nr:hypothetical protein [Candidatus Hodarchaeaceae archaeon]
MIPDERLSIVETIKKPEYREYARGVKGRLLRIVRAYVDAGSITADELISRPCELAKILEIRHR